MRLSILPILNSLFGFSCFFGIVSLPQPSVVTRRAEYPASISEHRSMRDSTDTTARIYLTFDDGPYKYTPPLTALLSEKGIRASFFIIGAHIDLSPWHDSVYQTVVAHPNFKVYNHTYSHDIQKGRIHQYYQNPQRVWQDILRNRTYLPPGVTITRLPGKSAWRIPGRKTRMDPQSDPLFRLLDSLRQPEFIVGWDYEWTSTTGQDRASMKSLITLVEKKLSRAPIHKRDVVILLHDYQFKTTQSLVLLGEFIDHFLQKGTIQFDWIEQLPGLESGAANRSGD